MERKLAEMTPRVLEAVDRLLTKNETKHPNNEWKMVPVGEHVTHAIRHLSQWVLARAEGCRTPPLDEESEEPMLAHAIARLAMAMELEHGSTD